MSDLIIVESPSKIRTIKRYLDKGSDVIASNGHLRDLPKSKLGVDIDKDFEPHYINIRGKESLIKDIKKKAKKYEHIYLAGDPDREGEAISWHLAQILGLDLNDNNRVTFNEITETGVRSGMSNPRKIDMNLVNAQQARRVLDRIVGYKLSPFLWRKIRRGLSAGRVQSVAVKMICDREEEIKRFVPKEYWSIDATLKADTSDKPFTAKLTLIDDSKAELFDKEHTDKILDRLNGAEYIAQNIKRGISRRSPSAPFTTSTLQQEASKRLNFQTRRTMMVAQELYEGVEINGLGLTGLITYMRTDSLRVSDEARKAAAEFILKNYGKDYLPEKPNIYKSKNNAQDAHEAIRPTHPELTPNDVKLSGVSNDQYRLYKLIWERFIASQMSKCLLNTIAVDISAANCIFRVTGYSVKFDGFTVLYEDVKDDSSDKKAIIPEIRKGDILKLIKLDGNQHFTQPPARYTEATLVKAFEETGIGRPSTYVPTITTILSRNYVERDAKQLKPTALGEVTNSLMSDQFKNIVDVKFTANMETSLDEVENGKKNWVEVLDGFYGDFSKSLDKAEQELEGKRIKVPDEQTDQMCEICGKPMVIKVGKFGKFMACSGFPECTNTKTIVIDSGGICPLCGKKVLKKKSKRGKIFYGCEDNPECKFMTWDLPTKKKCPNCGSTLFQKGGKNGSLVCHKEGCGYIGSVDNE